MPASEYVPFADLTEAHLREMAAELRDLRVRVAARGQDPAPIDTTLRLVEARLGAAVTAPRLSPALTVTPTAPEQAEPPPAWEENVRRVMALAPEHDAKEIGALLGFELTFVKRLLRYGREQEAKAAREAPEESESAEPPRQRRKRTPRETVAHALSDPNRGRPSYVQYAEQSQQRWDWWEDPAVQRWDWWEDPAVQRWDWWEDPAVRKRMGWE
jgi:hypothetical protein